MDESHSDINTAFGPRRSISSPYSDHHLLSSLIEIKNDLSAEVRALTRRMVHIDEQISQIHNILSPFYPSTNTNLQEEERSQPPPSLSPRPSVTSHTNQPSPNSPARPKDLHLSPKTSVDAKSTSDVKISPLFETSSFYTDANTRTQYFDANQSSSTISDVHEGSIPSKTNDRSMTPPSSRQMSDNDSLVLSIPPPPSIYNRSATSSLASLGISSAPRGSVSNKVAPASFRPMTNTRYNPGRSPKMKTRSQHSRTHIKRQQLAEQSTIIELESPLPKDTTNKNAPLLPTPSATATKSSTNVFRRFMIGSNNNTDKSTMSSSTLLYPPTSDDDHPASPASSGNDDDDYRPLTSSSSRHHHTPL